MKKALLIFTVILVSCSSLKEEKNLIRSHNLSLGPWLFELDLGQKILPFNASIQKEKDSGGYVIVIENGSEKIVIQEVNIEGDSIHITVPVYGSKFDGLMKSDSAISGFWRNPVRGKDYKIPFTARYGVEERFSGEHDTVPVDFGGNWSVTFSPEKEHSCVAVGVFDQSDDILTGTFLTETGDYRFLEGRVFGNHVRLSAFDGSHAFLFSATLGTNGEISGDFWSGIHWHETWRGYQSDSARIKHPDSLTKQVAHFDPMTLKFKSFQGDSIGLSDEKFSNKVIILQIMGSWCPNCADEARDFAELYDMFNDQGLEILGIAYEKTRDLKVAKQRIDKFKMDLKVKYDFVQGSGKCKSDASEEFPFLSGIKSFPTAVFIDSEGKIRKIHTGYYGPGTGPYYHKYKEEYEMFVEKLLRERSTPDLVDAGAMPATLK